MLPLKFIYSEKTTKFCEISTLLLSYVGPVKCKVEISQNFVAFSGYMNFKIRFQTYNGEPSKPNECVYHPGVPIFHEGLKFWSCCQRKTTDFQSFLDQKGCDFGKCKWKKDSVSCFH